MRKQRDAQYFGHGKKHKTVIRTVSLLLLLGWLFIQSDTSAHAQSQGQNYQAVGGTMAGVGVMYGVGAGVCMAMSAGGCAPIAIAGGIMAGVGGTIGAMGSASGVGSRGHTGPYPEDMPDSDEDCGIDCGSSGGPGQVENYGWLPW